MRPTDAALRTPAAMVLALALGGLGLSALPCRAGDEAVATANPSASLPAEPRPVAVEQVPAASRGPDVLQDEPPIPDRKPHGAVEVGVGTNGYRRAAGVVTAPIGKTGEVTIAVDKSEGRSRVW